MMRIGEKKPVPIEMMYSWTNADIVNGKSKRRGLNGINCNKREKKGSVEMENSSSSSPFCHPGKCSYVYTRAQEGSTCDKTQQSECYSTSPAI